MFEPFLNWEVHKKNHGSNFPHGPLLKKKVKYDSQARKGYRKEKNKYKFRKLYDEKFVYSIKQKHEIEKSQKICFGYLIRLVLINGKYWSVKLIFS